VGFSISSGSEKKVSMTLWQGFSWFTLSSTGHRNYIHSLTEGRKRFSEEMQLLIILVPVYQPTCCHIPEDRSKEYLDFPFFGQSMGQACPVS